MTTGFGFGDLFDRVSISSIYSLFFLVLRVQYLYALPFVTPEGALQNVPVSILAPTLPFVAPRDFLQNHPTPIPAPAFLDLTYPYEPLLACPDLTYPYELFPAFPDLAYPYEIFENPPGILSNQEVETAMNPSFLPYCDPVPSSSSPQIDSPANNTASLRTIYSAPIPSSPAPALGQNAMGHPSNWHKIPQTVYGWGKKRWDYQPSEPILFHVNGRPGVNMGDALRNEFTGLDGRDDPMFQDGVDAFSCRLMVCSLRQLLPVFIFDEPIQFPGYPANRKPQVGTLAPVSLSGIDYGGRFLQSTGIRIAIQ